MAAIGFDMEDVRKMQETIAELVEALRDLLAESPDKEMEEAILANVEQNEKHIAVRYFQAEAKARAVLAKHTKETQ